MKEFMNDYDIYTLDKAYDFASAPVYDKPKRKSKAYKEILELLDQDNFTELSKTYDVEIIPGLVVVTTHPTLYKYEIGDRVYSDIFYDIKVIQHRGDLEFTSVYLNYHGFDGNKDVMNEHFLVEKVITIFGELNKVDHNMLLGPDGDIVMQVPKGKDHASLIRSAVLAKR